MTNILARTKTDPTKVRDEERDSVGGSYIWESDTYAVIISEAYADLTPNGAVMVNLVYKDQTGREITQRECVASGDAKGNSPTFDVRDTNGKPTGEKRKLPGLAKIDSICELVAGKALAEVSENTAVKIVMKWDTDSKAKVERKADMLMDLVNQNVIIGVQKQIVDKQAKGDDGKYHNTGETRDANEIDKVFDGITGRTLTEVKGKLADPVFIHTWRESNKGKTFDETKDKVGSKSSAKNGAPGATPATTKSLFD